MAGKLFGRKKDADDDYDDDSSSDTDTDSDMGDSEESLESSGVSPSKNFMKKMTGKSKHKGHLFSNRKKKNPGKKHFFGRK